MYNYVAIRLYLYYKMCILAGLVISLMFSWSRVHDILCETSSKMAKSHLRICVNQRRFADSDRLTGQIF